MDLKACLVNCLLKMPFQARWFFVRYVAMFLFSKIQAGNLVEVLRKRTQTLAFISCKFIGKVP